MRLDRVLLIQENSRQKQHAEFRECHCLKRAFEFHGVPCDIWGRGHEGYSELPNWRDYDLIINLEQRAHRYGDWIPDLSQAKTIKFLWAIDAHSLGTWRFDDEFERGRYHLLLHSTKRLVMQRPQRHWFPNSWDDDLIAPRSVPERAQVGFVGDVSNRKDWIELLKAQEFTFQHDYMVHGQEMVDCLNSYGMCWNRNFSFDLNYRNFEVLGAGGVLLTNEVEGYKELGFEDGVNYLSYRNAKEMLNKISAWLSESAERQQQLRENALLLASQHTYKKRLERLLEEVSWKF